MKGNKIFIDAKDTATMVQLVPELNDYNDIVAMIVDATTFAIIAEGECGMSYAMGCVATVFDGYSVETIK